MESILLSNSAGGDRDGGEEEESEVGDMREVAEGELKAPGEDEQVILNPV